MPTDEQIREIDAALKKARAARARGEDADDLYAAAEELMRKYGAAEEPPPGPDGEP